MKRKLLTRLLCLVLSIFAILGLAGCNDTPATDTNPPDISGKEPTVLAKELTVALKNYLQSDSFTNEVQTANTAQARLPLLYLKYVDASFYSVDNVVQLKKYLNYINDLIYEGELQDYKYSSSQITSWYGITDYLYTWSLVYNQYLHWCHDTNNTDTTYSIYIPIIEKYLNKIDTWIANGSKEHEFAGETVNNDNLYYTGYNVVNSFSANSLTRAPYEWFEELLAIVAEETGLTVGHKEFLNAYQRAENIDASELRNYGKTTLLPLWKNVLPITQVAFGYNDRNILPLIAANINIKNATPFCDEWMLSYYDKNNDGTFVTDGGTPNWVGFSGRPICASLYKDNEKYSVAYEKTMQGYFPFTDGWNQPLDEMVNLDRLCNYYNHTLTTGASVAPQYALLTAMMHGIDVEHYQKEVPSPEFNETGDETFNLITMWRETLPRDDDSNYKITNAANMAVAIAYLAQENGTIAPTPFGEYSANAAIIKL